MIQKLLILFLLPISLFASRLDLLEYELKKDLTYLNFPPKNWRAENDPTCDVAIIGAGQSGLSLAFALQQQGITNVKVFDAAEIGKEGPWKTTARMKTLRSKKELPGPSLNMAKLTFRAWYEAQYGEKFWNSLVKIPTHLWVSYLQWYKKVLGIVVFNQHKLINIVPNGDQTLQLMFENGAQITARKVVLATGRMGFGGLEIPNYVTAVPKQKWVHAGENFDPSLFNKKEVCIVGAGASAFDAAAVALENGATSLKMVMRRSEIPKVNRFSEHSSVGFLRGYYFLDDLRKAEIFKEAWDIGVPPPIESLERVKPYKNFELLLSSTIKKMSLSSDKVQVETTNGSFTADLIVLATGYAIDASKQPELQTIFKQIKLWEETEAELSKKLGNFPYLGFHFQFLERKSGTAPYLKNIHCFNFASFLSQWRISGDIDCLSIGALRLAEGIAEELFQDL